MEPTTPKKVDISKLLYVILMVAVYTVALL